MALNPMVEVLFFVFGSIGMTQIIVESTLSKNIKDKVKKYTPSFLMPVTDFFLSLTGCYQCTGFWAGMFISAIMLIPCAESYWDYGKIFVGGCFSSCICPFWTSILLYIDSKTVISQ